MTTEIVYVPFLDKKIRLDDQSDLIRWWDGDPCADVPESIPAEELFREEYLPEIGKALAIWRECEWEPETTVSVEYIPTPDCSGMVPSTHTTIVVWRLVKGNPLPWMDHTMSDESVRRYAIVKAAEADGSYAAALKAAAQQWLDKAIAEGGEIVDNGLPPYFDLNPGILRDLKDWGWNAPEGTVAGFDGDECVVCIPGQSPIFGDCTETLAEKLGLDV